MMDFNYHRVNVIGAGRLGKVMAYLFAKYLNMEIIGICNQSVASSERAALEIGQGNAVASIALLEPADIYLIAVPDTKIRQIALELKASQISKNALVIHFSAILSTDVLSVLDCHLASVHPMQSFSDFHLALRNFKGTFCAIETPEEIILNALTTMLSGLGAKPFSIQADAKTLYHSGAVIAANYTVTLAHVAKTCLQATGISDVDAMEMIIPLMQSVLDNLKTQKDCQLALTGPIARADIATVAQHLQALGSLPEIKTLYQLLGKMTLELVDTHSSNRAKWSDLFE